jgi:hypothetical protein
VSGELVVRSQPSLSALERIHQLEAAMIREGLATFDVDAHTTHHHCKGVYTRQFLLPAGTYAVGKMHAQENMFVIVSGDVSISTDEGVMRIQAPFMCVTKPGTKRVAFAHTDTVMLNFHANPDDVQDMEVLEARYVIPHEKELETLTRLCKDAAPQLEHQAQEAA